MHGTHGTLRRKDVDRRLARAAGQLHQADFVHRHTSSGLIERLSPMQANVSHIVDLGSATGRDGKVLKEQFPGALVVGIDRSTAMLAEASRSRSWVAKWFFKASYLRADAEKLPLAGGSIDLVYANLLLPWIDDHGAVFAEVARVLRKDGLFVFSTLGPDSFRELRDAWAGIDSRQHVREFPDMHDVGDEIVRSGLRDPVLDVDSLVLQYQNTRDLFRDIVSTGAGNSLRHRHQALTGKDVMRRLATRLAGNGGECPFSLRLELVFGHAWGGGPTAGPGEYRVRAADIGRRRR
jgi:malonyl-CoA O-methyltransferase